MRYNRCLPLPFHYPSTRAVLTGARFPLAELTGRVKPVTRQLGPSTRVVETGLYTYAGVNVALLVQWLFVGLI